MGKKILISLLVLLFFGFQISLDTKVFAQNGNVVSFRADRIALINGEPFFPIGLFTEQMPNLPEDFFAEISDPETAGFNLVRLVDTDVISKTPEDYAFLSTHNLKAWLTINSSLTVDKDTKLRTLIANYKNANFLLAWEGIDEPCYKYYNGNSLFDPNKVNQNFPGYQTLKNLDTNHPLWHNHWPKVGTGGPCAIPWNINTNTNVSGVDVYPVGRSDYELEDVGFFTEWSSELLTPRGPVWMVLQGFGWGDIEGLSGRRPNYSEIRFMTYDALVHKQEVSDQIIPGATGIFYYGLAIVNKKECGGNPVCEKNGDGMRETQIFSDLKKISHELKQLELGLLGHINPEFISNNSQVVVLAKETNNETFVFVVNESPSSQNVTIPGFSDQYTVKEFFSNEELLVINRSASLTLLPYSVKILCQKASPSLSLSLGWNEITWADISGKKASDIPPECPIAVSKQNFWFKPYVRNFGGVNFGFENGKSYYLKCNQEMIWGL
ncbi:MAG TPA: alpha-glucosidase C-terminal domain-containing protein [Candidatus Bathyarchaeia archaeon]|nr:alpha-glucosidase C-terminal domain-containing protein [Candidatus Bathyarchaeia archaeon]